MAIADWFFKRPGRGKDRVDLNLPALRKWFADRAPRLEGKTVEPDLVRARLADRCRDAALEPLAPADFDALAGGLEDEAWRRLALAVSALDLPAPREALARLAALPGDGAAPLVQTAFVGLARETPLLTMALLRQSPLRTEEFTRQFIARLGAGVEGESLNQSHDRLVRLDYGRLLAEAERAKAAAAERMEYLRKLEEEREANRPRRGKW